MVSPYVSIIIPVYNEEKRLRRCLDSAVNQTFKDIEIIIVDDASTDASRKIISGYCSRDNRVKAIFNSTNKGQGESRNTGIKNAHGEYIFFLDSDDYLLVNGIETLRKIAVEYGDDIVIGKTRSSIDQDSIYVTREKRNIKITDHPSLLYNHSAWNKLIKRSFISASNIEFEPGSHAEDVIFALKCNLLADKISITVRPTYIYHWNGQVNNVTREKILAAREKVLTALKIVENDGRLSLINEMQKKTARNVYSTMVRVSMVLNRKEQYDHLQWWYPVIAGMPRKIFDDIPAKPGIFCRLIADDRIDDALKFWQKTMVIRKLTDNRLIKYFARLKKAYCNSTECN